MERGGKGQGRSGKLKNHEECLSHSRGQQLWEIWPLSARVFAMLPLSYRAHLKEIKLQPL